MPDFSVGTIFAVAKLELSSSLNSPLGLLMTLPPGSPSPPDSISLADPPRRPRVVIIGGGFGGLQAAKSLRKAQADVTLIDRRNFHLFQPLLYQVATGELSPANIAAPLRTLLRRQANTSVLLGEVTRVDLQTRRIVTTDQWIDFDYVIVATGSTHHYFGQDQWKRFAPGLKTIENATQIRRDVLGAFEAAEKLAAERDASVHDADPDTNVPASIAELLTFVIVGGGPTGCEMAGTIAEIARHTLRHDFRFIQPSSAQVILIEGGKAPLDVYPAPLPQRAAADLKRLGVNVITGTRVTDIQASHVVVHDVASGVSRTIATRTVVWAAGVKASPLGEKICEAAGIAPARGGRVPVRSDLSVAGHPHVFVLGDLAFLEDEQHGELPGLAPVATQMGDHAAKGILADIAGRHRTPFRYRDKGSLAVIGRYSAVGLIGNWKVKGILAWAIWLMIHLMVITLFRNRLLVLSQWGWTFLTRDRSSRLIADGPNSDIATMEQATGWDHD